MNTWFTQEAIDLCFIIEGICPNYGCHVALTGGCLYKFGERKDLDILFYRIRQVEKIDYEGLFNELRKVGIIKVSGFGWCYKAIYNEKSIDIFFPEEQNGEYVSLINNNEICDEIKLLKDIRKSR